MSLVNFTCRGCGTKHYKFDNDIYIELCKNCSKGVNFPTDKSFTLKHNKFNATEIELLDYISDNFYCINELQQISDTHTEKDKALETNHDKLKSKYKALKKRNNEIEDKVSFLEEKIEALQVAHESLLDTFRGYNK